MDVGDRPRWVRWSSVRVTEKASGSEQGYVNVKAGVAGSRSGSIGVSVGEEAAAEGVQAIGGAWIAQEAGAQCGGPGSDGD